MAYVILIGTDAALLEGLAQSLAAVGHRPYVTASLVDARDHATAHPPLVMIIDRMLASSAGAEVLALPTVAGGARVIYRTAAMSAAPLLPALQRAVLADVMLPLERQRLSALVQSIAARAKTTGRASRVEPPERRA
jgi:DNA-binding NtrC family response regulator